MEERDLRRSPSTTTRARSSNPLQGHFDDVRSFWHLVAVDQRLGQFHLKDDAWTFLSVLQERPDLTATAALTDATDRVWLAYRDTIAVLDRGRIRRFFTTEGLDVGPLLAMAHDGQRLWAGGESGLAFLDSDRFRTLHAAGGTGLGPVTGILLPSHDGVWLSAGPGIVHVPEGEVQQALRDPTHRVHYEVFDLVSDLPEALQRRHTGAPFGSAVEGSDGVLWFVTARGVVAVDRSRIQRNQLPPPVLIRSIVADDTPYSLHERVALPALTRNLRIDYTAPSLSIPERVRFRYRLDGWDTDWRDAGAERTAAYTGLGPGPYAFRVIACNNDGVWNESGAVLAFTVAPAWFQTVWFRGLVFVAIATLLWGLYRLRLRQVAVALSSRFDERLDERTRIARELHDTLLQTIQASKLVADDTLKQADDSARMRHALQQLAEWLAHAVQEGRAALNSLRAATVEGDDLIGAIRRATQTDVNPAGMAVSFAVTGDDVPIHPIVGDEICRIAYEAIHNARRHSAATRVEVVLTYGHELTLRVTDNGIGIDPGIADGGRSGHFGLQGMRERAARISARLTVASAAGSGTEITLIVPGHTAFRTAMSPHVARD